MANAAYRQLTIMQRLLTGEVVRKDELAHQFSISLRAVQRDISQVRAFIADQWPIYRLTYLPEYQGYTLNLYQNTVSKGALLILIKILLASRSLTTAEMTQTIDNLLALIPHADREELLPIIKNERFYYTPVHHQQPLLQRIWELSQDILQHRTLTIDYEKIAYQLVTRTVLPEAIIFSEYYFYLVAYYPVYKQNLFYRIDRIRHVREADEQISQSRGARFEDGRLRQVVHYMQTGQKMTIQFEFFGFAEAALDRFPTAKILTRNSKRHSVLIEAEVFDQGAKMWLLSQGPSVRVVSPPELVQEMKQRIQAMQDLYTGEDKTSNNGHE